MFCSKCGNANGEGERFCRSCGKDLPVISLTIVDRTLSKPTVVSGDPDELTGKGVGKVIIGDGFFIVAVILAATTGSVGSMWLFLLIPAFFFFGKGFAEIFHARQIRRRLKAKVLQAGSQHSELPPARPSAIEAFGKVISGELTPLPSVTERTTRDLN